MTSAPPRLDPATTTQRGRVARGLTVAVVAAGVLAVWLAGRQITREGGDLHLRDGYLVVGPFDVVLTARVLLAVAGRGRGRGVGAGAGPHGSAGRCCSRRAPPGRAAWAVALALSSGWDALAAPMATEHEYVADVGRVGDLGTFLSTFVDSVPVDSPDPWVTHVSGHPPGALLAFVAARPHRAGRARLGRGAVHRRRGARRAGRAGHRPGRRRRGRRPHRRALRRPPPGAVWIATSADALFAGVTAWGIALLALAAARAPSRAGCGAALAGGLLLGLSLYLSFGLTAAGLIALAVVLVQKGRLGWAGVLRVLAVAAVGVALVAALFTLGGYWWFEGIEVDVAAGPRRRRLRGPRPPPHYFLFGNVAAAALAAGPAVVAGLAGLRGRLALAAAGGAGRDGGQRPLGPGARRDRADLAAVRRLAAARRPRRCRADSHRFWLPSRRCWRSPWRSSVRSPW